MFEGVFSLLAKAFLSVYWPMLESYKSDMKTHTVLFPAYAAGFCIGLMDDGFNYALGRYLHWRRGGLW